MKGGDYRRSHRARARWCAGTWLSQLLVAGKHTPGHRWVLGLLAPQRGVGAWCPHLQYSVNFSECEPWNQDSAKQGVGLGHPLPAGWRVPGLEDLCLCTRELQPVEGREGFEDGRGVPGWSILVGVPCRGERKSEACRI